MSNKLFYGLALLTLILAVSIRIVWQLEYHETPFSRILFLDSEYYDYQAIEIAQGDIAGGEQVYFFGPGYSYTLAIIYWIFGHSREAVRILQSISGILSSLMVFHMALSLYGRSAALFSLALIALNPIPVFYEAHILMASFLLFQFTMFCWIMINYYGRNRMWPYIICGLLIGTMSAYRGNFLVLPLALCFAAFAVDASWKRRVLLAITPVYFAFIVILPITLRNYSIDGRWPVITSNVGVLLWHGAISGDQAVINTAMEIDRAGIMVPEGPDEQGSLVEMAQAMLEKADESDRWLQRVLWIFRFDTSGMIRNYFIKLGTFFNHLEIPKNVSFQFFRARHPVLALPLPGLRIISPLFITALFMGNSWKGRNLSVTISVLLYTLIMSLFFVNGRFRMPVLGIMTLYAAVPLRYSMEIFNNARIKSSKASWCYPMILSTIFVLSFLLANWPINDHLYPPSAGYYQLAHVQMKSDMMDQAAETLRTHISMDPLHIKSYNDLVHILIQQNRLDEAASIAVQGLNVMPVYDKLHFNLGIILARQGKIHEAIARMEEGLQYGYLDTSAHKITGDMLAGIHRYREAAMRYREVLKLEPDHIEAAQKLLLCLYTMGELPEALQVLKRPGVLETADPYISGHLLMLAGKTDLAREQLFKVTRNSDNYMDARSQLAVLALKDNNPEAAIGFLEEARRISPNNTSILYDLGLIYLQLGDAEQAAQNFRHILIISPNDRKARAMLIESLIIAEKIPEARDAAKALPPEMISPALADKLGL